MTTPVAPQSRTTTSQTAATAEPANDAVCPAETVTSASPRSAGWDPYEVWRTRVLSAQTAGAKKA
jgi:hypothetical protein